MSAAPIDLASAMRARARERQRADDARRRLVLDRAQETLREILRAEVARRAWIIGSVAWGAFGLRSDLDVVVEGADSRVRVAIADRLGNATGVAVDLLLDEELEPSFWARVHAEGLEVHGA